MCFVQNKPILYFLTVGKKMNHPISTRDDGDYCTEEEILLAYFVCFILSVLHFDCHQLKEIDGSDPPPPFLRLRLIPFHFPTRSRFVSVQSKLLFRTTAAETINSENIRTLKSHDP